MELGRRLWLEVNCTEGFEPDYSSSWNQMILGIGQFVRSVDGTVAYRILSEPPPLTITISCPFIGEDENQAEPDVTWIFSLYETGSIEPGVLEGVVSAYPRPEWGAHLNGYGQLTGSLLYMNGGFFEDPNFGSFEGVALAFNSEGRLTLAANYFETVVYDPPI